MALLGDAKLFFCLAFFACCCLEVSLAEIPADCCLSVGLHRFRKHAIVDYRHQVAGQGCKISATILVNRSKMQLCASADTGPVRKIIAHVNKLRKFCKKNNYVLKRCDGVKRE